jgi:hypothetical protein
VCRQFPVRQVAHFEVGYPAECGPGQLGPDLVLAAVRRDQKHAFEGVNRRAKSQVEHADDAGVDGRRVLDLIGGNDAAGCLVHPQDVDQPDGVGPVARREAREVGQTSVAELSAAHRAVPVVGGNPDAVSERFPKVAEPSLDLGMRMKPSPP